MPVTFNLRHLEDDNIHLKDALPVAELDVENLDEMIHVSHPLHYDLEVQKMENAILVTGRLNLKLDCECVRCLRPFEHRVHLDNWACHLPLEGEEKVEVVNDCVDLTPYLREDIVLAFPQHPVCGPECSGPKVPSKSAKPGAQEQASDAASAWAELNKLKF